ncbi:MAG: hypothetical protein AAAFM81_12850 [Pseudomonadota bacterium]
MNSRIIQVSTIFVVAVLVTLLGVFFFFKPVEVSDTSFVSVNPAVAVIVYIGLSVWMFVWAAAQTRSAYKAAFIVIAPQAILIVDLAFRGNRGFFTALAGIVLLAVTWLIVAYTYSLFERRKDGP